MEQRIMDVLQGREDNYILPFFWMHGAKESDTRRLMQAVYDCGIRAVCLESRPHPDYVGEQWWHDVDIILEEAKKRDMRVWILDDSHFPTGYANGAAVDAPRRLKRISLMERHYDITGPQRGTKLDIGKHLNWNARTRQTDEEYYQEKLEAVLLAKVAEDGGTEVRHARVDLEKTDGERRAYARGENAESDNVPRKEAKGKQAGEKWDWKREFDDAGKTARTIAQVQNVTGQIEDGWLYLDLPEGEYRVYVLTTKLHAAMMLGDGISLLEKDSVRLLIDEVYEAHYKRYAPYFGNTIAGFFSDEPGFFNLSDRGYGYAARTGEESVPLPWTEDVYGELRENFGERTEEMLPLLFGDSSAVPGQEREIRVRYMDIVSRKYGENFSGQLGQWCREHGVEYIGHIVEDAPGYERLGQSPGHYFRAIRGQDMAGIDIVLNGLMPGEDRGQGLFYHYGLAQLAGSLANQAPHQKGRALCEIFGAYGWAEGVTLMKWMADHMLTGGINYFVPHAFTDREFPDEDCPPHFWAQGKNPQYPFMPVLFGYMNRMAHLLSGGEPLVRNAILFEAESDWAGEACPYFLLGRELLERQVPYHVVCADDLKETWEEEGLLRIGNMRYANLFIPPAAYLARETAEVLQRLEKKGINIFFVGGKPRGYSGEELPELESVPEIGIEEMCMLAAEAAVLKVTADRDAEETGRLVEDISARKAVAEDMQGTDGISGLRCYSYRQQGMRIHMLQNASWSKAVSARILFEDSNPDTEIIRYDGMEQKIYRTISGQTADGKQSIRIRLEPMEAHVYLECAGGAEWENGFLEEEPCWNTAAVYKGGYRIERAEYHRPDAWLECGTTDTLYDIARKYPGFAGTLRYSLEYADEGYRQVLLEDASEAVEVFCDGMSLGKRIAPPYRYKLPASESNTVHRLRIEVSTTLVNAVPDSLSCKRPVAPAGFCGKVLFLK